MVLAILILSNALYSSNLAFSDEETHMHIRLKIILGIISQLSKFPQTTWWGCFSTWSSF